MTAGAKALLADEMYSDLVPLEYTPAVAAVVADAVLAALLDACEVREQFGVRMEGIDDFWPYEPTREWAEKAIASRAKRRWPASHLIRRCVLETPAEQVS